MSRRTLVIIIIVIALAVLGYLAHTFDLLGLAKAVHGNAAASH
jgi:hypothetical protein